ncbi:MAG: hypothetical protein KFF50_16520 [Desulfatitalea sp.]|nr:hypothetical protein [Desulfatitalea sp.]
MHRFEPNPLRWFLNFFDDVNFRHWAFDVSGECHGFITWQKTTTFANNLWLAVPEDLHDAPLADALDGVRMRLSNRHPLSIDYPKGRHTPVFTDQGFYHFRSLIWMSLDLN